MEDKNQNLIPDSWDPYIGIVFAVIAGLLALAIEGKWFGDSYAAWLPRALAAIGVLSSIFKYGAISMRSRSGDK